MWGLGFLVFARSIADSEGSTAVIFVAPKFKNVSVVRPSPQPASRRARSVNGMLR